MCSQCRHTGYAYETHSTGAPIKRQAKIDGSECQGQGRALLPLVTALSIKHARQHNIESKHISSIDKVFAILQMSFSSRSIYSMEYLLIQYALCCEPEHTYSTYVTTYLCTVNSHHVTSVLQTVEFHSLRNEAHEKTRTKQIARRHAKVGQPTDKS